MVQQFQFVLFKQFKFCRIQQQFEFKQLQQPGLQQQLQQQFQRKRIPRSRGWRLR
jgi:hypothetical protein